MAYKGEPINEIPESWTTIEDLRDNLVTQMVLNSDYKSSTGEEMPAEIFDSLVGSMTRMALAIYKGDFPEGDPNDPTTYANLYYLNDNLYYRTTTGDQTSNYIKLWDSNNSNGLGFDWIMRDGFVHGSISSSDFMSGFTGFGWEIDEFGNAVFDSLTVRKTLSVYELLIEKIRSINGGIVTSVANGVVDRLVDNIVYLKDDFTTFVVGDRVRSQKFTGRGTKYYEAEVTELVADNAIRLENFIGDYYPEPGDELVQWGNINDESRQSFLYQTARDGGYFSVLTGVDSDDLEDKEVVRLGNIDSIVTTTWGPLSGYGIYVKGNGYFEDVYISGNIVVTGGNAATHDDVSNAVIDFSSLLGDLAYEDLIEYAKLGDTIIEGGYIKTSLIDVSQITVTIGQIEDLGLLASKDTVEWGTDIDSIPSYLQSTAPDNSLSITATFLGFHETGTNWPVRIQNDNGVGKFYVGGGTQYMEWDGTQLSILGDLRQANVDPTWAFYNDGTAKIGTFTIGGTAPYYGSLISNAGSVYIRAGTGSRYSAIGTNVGQLGYNTNAIFYANVEEGVTTMDIFAKTTTFSSTATGLHVEAVSDYVYESGDGYGMSIAVHAEASAEYTEGGIGIALYGSVDNIDSITFGDNWNYGKSFAGYFDGNVKINPDYSLFGKINGIFNINRIASTGVDGIFLSREYFYVIYTSTTTDGELFLDNNPITGKCYWIMRTGPVNLIVYGNGNNILMNSGTSVTSYTLQNVRDLYMFTWDGVYWQFHWISRGS